MRVNWGYSWSLVRNWRTSRRGCGPRSRRREPWPGSNKSHISISRRIRVNFFFFFFAFFYPCGLSLCFNLTTPLPYSSHHPSLSAIFRLNLCLGEGINVAVGIYKTAGTVRKPAAIRLYRETNKPVNSKTRTFHTQTGSLLLPSEINKAQVRAHCQIFKLSHILNTVC